ncbi:MAG TPA: hypothetical protein VGB37_15285 [Candidatus Lokiarchaeia archaeon]
MSDSKENKNDLSSKLNDLSSKLNDLSNIFQKFGLDFITKFGQSTYNIKILVDKIDDFNSTMLDIKSLIPVLYKIVENQNNLKSEIKLIRSLIEKSNMVSSKEKIEIKSTEQDLVPPKNKNQTIRNQFEEFKKKIENSIDLISIINNLNALKQSIFEATGGHKILYDISQEIKKLDNLETFSDEIIENLREKVEIWIGKI